MSTEMICGPLVVEQELHSDILRRLVAQSREHELGDSDRFKNRSRLNESKTNQQCYVEDQS